MAAALSECICGSQCGVIAIPKFYKTLLLLYGGGPAIEFCIKVSIGIK